MKKEDVISLVIYFLMIAVAIIVGLTVVRDTIANVSFAPMNPFLAVILIIVCGLIINIVGLELLHFAGAKMGGYKVFSINFLGLCFETTNGKIWPQIFCVIFR